MATQLLMKRQAYVAVATGSTSSGSTITTRVSIGDLDKDAWDADKAVAIVMALGPCLQETVYNVPMVATYHITE